MCVSYSSQTLVAVLLQLYSASSPFQTLTKEEVPTRTAAVEVKEMWQNHAWDVAAGPTTCFLCQACCDWGGKVSSANKGKHRTVGTPQRVWYSESLEYRVTQEIGCGQLD
jgi:hypothetical protein